MNRLNPLKLFRSERYGERDKISIAIREAEVHRRALLLLRSRLKLRAHSLFEAAAKALEVKDQQRAAVLAAENAMLKKVIKVVNISELALTKIVIRLESIRDLGDIMMHIASAFDAVRNVSKTVSNINSAFEEVAQEFDMTLARALEELRFVPPDLPLQFDSEGVKDLVETARSLVDEKMSQLEDQVPKMIMEQTEDRLKSRPVSQTLLATGGGEAEDNFSPILLSTPQVEDIQTSSNSLDPSLFHNTSLDEVDEGALKMVAREKVRSKRLVKR